MESTRPREVGLVVDRNGFTLIELIVVLAVMSLVLTLVMPNVGRPSGRYALAATAHDVATALRLTRDKAIAESRTKRFVVYASGFGSGDDQHSQHVSSGVGLVFLASDHPKSPRPAGTIRFYPDGSSTGGQIALTAGTNS